ncbi:MAG TPA: hypothetical protein VN408_25260 [Actinoplanes sp.]|nr:hypothetical protein [Actinoplanes sp.]
MEILTFTLIAPLMLLIALIVHSAAQNRHTRTLQRIAGIERKLDLIMAHHGITLPEPEHPDVVEHLRGGRKIHAVKAYRDRTGAGLAEAKEAVEQIARDHRV